MKKLLLLSIIMFCYGFIVKAQDYKPMVNNDTLFYQLDTVAGSMVQKIPLESSDTQLMRLIKWKDGYWETEMHNSKFPKTIFIPGYVFIQDDPSYREELAIYSSKAKRANRIYLNYLIKKYGKDKGSDYYYHIPCIGMNSTMLIKCIGNPDKIHSTVTAKGSTDQWVYYSRTDKPQYYYLRNGIITAIQN